MARPKKFKTPKDLQKVIDEYMSYIELEGKPPTIAGIAYYTGINRTTIYNYIKQDEFKPIIDEFIAWVIMKLEEMIISNAGNVTGLIFILKQYGYSDKTQVVNEQRLEIGTDIIEKYLKE